MNHHYNHFQCTCGNNKSIKAGLSHVATAAVDVWSFGMMLYWLCTGADYFADIQHDDIMSQLIDTTFTVSLAAVDHKSIAYGCLKDRLLNIEQRARESIDTVMQQHSYFKQGAIATHHSNLAALSTEQITLVKDSIAKLDQVQSQAEKHHTEVKTAIAVVSTKVDDMATSVKILEQQLTIMDEKLDAITAKTTVMSKVITHLSQVSIHVFIQADYALALTGMQSLHTSLLLLLTLGINM
jgi:serine/threonine protein kinase